MRAWPQPCCCCCRHVVYIADESSRCAFDRSNDPLYSTARGKAFRRAIYLFAASPYMCTCSMPSWSQDESAEDWSTACTSTQYVR